MARYDPVCRDEHTEQVHVIKWARFMQETRGYTALRLLFAVPNGGHRNRVTAAKMQGEGVKSGVPDLFLPAPRAPWHGLFIEMKIRKGGTVSPNQRLWLEELRRAGYAVVVARGSDEAIEALKNYLAGRAVPIWRPGKEKARNENVGN